MGQARPGNLNERTTASATFDSHRWLAPRPPPSIGAQMSRKRDQIDREDREGRSRCMYNCIHGVR
jgi:hypothetical protein